MRSPTNPPLFPYTTLFRSHPRLAGGVVAGEVTVGQRVQGWFGVIVIQIRHEVVQREQPLPCGKRSEEHTSELQSRGHLGCRLLLEKTNESVMTMTRRLRST